ncbi:MAG: hypothetical protein EHM41_07435 [Chloroflexi bacterium]|nr:MAG: hypothetical protein EHM41_07435 [Chloroflexota bacterium]
MDATDEYIGKKLKNFSKEYQAPRNGKLRLLQAARHCTPNSDEIIDSIAVNNREVDVGFVYNLVFRPIDIPNINTLRWGLSNIRVVM